jgi:hypothetical protein
MPWVLDLGGELIQLIESLEMWAMMSAARLVSADLGFPGMPGANLIAGADGR